MKLYQYIFCFFLLTCVNCDAQHVVIPGSSKYLVRYAKHPGYLILKDGKKITGVFEYADMEFPDYNLKRYSADGATLIERIRMKNIQYAVMSGGDSILSQKDSTYFYNLKNDHRLYRQLTDGAIQIYDDLFNINERPNLVRNYLTVTAHGEIYQIDSFNELISFLEKLHYPLPDKTGTTQNVMRIMNGK